MFEFLNAFVQNGFSNVSIIEGGYHDVSKLVHGLNLEIVNHHPDYCSVCRSNGNNKSPSFFNIINKVIDKTGNQKICIEKISYLNRRKIRTVG